MRFIVKNPDTGKFNVYSTVVDAFVLDEMTKDELEEYYLSRYGTEGAKDLPREIGLADKANQNPYGYGRREHYNHYKMWHDHSTIHAHGSCSPDSAISDDNCGICKDIKNDE